MALYTYIKRDCKLKYVSLEDPLPPTMYELGETYEDYINNLWVLLSAEQVAFHEEHPEATVYEVWNMQITPPPVRTLEDAKREMIDTIDRYDNSDEVNAFTINGTIKSWLTPLERSNYKDSIDAAKVMGLETVSFFVGDILFTVTPAAGEQMLAQVQLYADACFIVTKQHKMAVEALETIEAVDNFNYREGYPEMINFDVA